LLLLSLTSAQNNVDSPQILRREGEENRFKVKFIEDVWKARVMAKSDALYESGTLCSKQMIFSLGTVANIIVGDLSARRDREITECGMRRGECFHGV
jgi:hypothetical protein